MHRMTWTMIRLDLARSAAFPDGSATHSYLLRVPLTHDGVIDAAAVASHPDQATVLRSWPDEAERRGYLMLGEEGWHFSYAPGDADDEPIFHLETHTLVPGGYVTIRETDGDELCFRVTACDAMPLPA